MQRYWYIYGDIKFINLQIVLLNAVRNSAKVALHQLLPVLLIKRKLVRKDVNLCLGQFRQAL